MLDIGWKNIIEQSNEINDSIKKIIALSEKYSVFILTKINSEQEQEEKRKFLNANGIKDIIFVPYNISKAKIVNPIDSYLIDDDIENLEKWEMENGIAIMFNKNLCNYDEYGNISDKYPIINDLLEIDSIIKQRKVKGLIHG